MAVTVYTEDEILALALAYLQAAYPGKPVGPGTYLGQQARSLAQLVGAIEQGIQAADYDGVPAYDTASTLIKSRCSPEALDNWAVTFGLPSNRGAGLYGRNAAQAAQGGAGLIVGNAGIILPTGTLLVDLSGQVQVKLAAGVTIPGGGSISGSFQAVSPGAAGNLAVGTTLSWQSPPAGLQPRVTLTTALSGGYDKESDLLLLARLLAHLQNPPKGGTANDYRVWAESATDATTGASVGIVRAFVFKGRSGLGTEDILITQAGSGSGRDPGATKAAAVQTFIEARRPVNDSPTVIRPYFDPARGLTIEVQVQPAAGYSFDWTMTGSFQLTGSSTTTALRALTAGVPAALLAAITAGKKPRIQLSLPAISPIPYVVTVLSEDHVSIAGTTIFAIKETLPAAPGAGVKIWPASSAVVPVAISLLSYIDQVGPSQQSGTADAVTDSWEAIVTIGKLAWAALSTLDSLGQRMLVYSPSVGSGVGVKMNGFAADWPLYDNLLLGPELPWAYQINVIPIQ